MISPAQTLATIPAGLRGALLEEYRQIVQNYAERRWSPAELSGGRFCEIVYTILDGYAKGSFPASPSKPRDLITACRALEAHTNVPRSFQILIPRLLPALYEIRNNRGVGHVGGDVDPNHMDATAVLEICSWVMAELVRVLHEVTVSDAQAVVDSMVERRIPLVWSSEGMKRVLDPKLSLKDTILLLIGSAPGRVLVADLLMWSGYKDRAYFLRLLRRLHRERFVELSTDETSLQILPPGAKYVAKLVASRIAA